MDQYVRICKSCNKKLYYKSNSSYWLANKKGSLCKSCTAKLKSEQKRKCDISPLLEETPEAYYWVGFLLADGHFRNGRIKLCLSIKDKQQVINFANFIKWTGKIDVYENNGGEYISIASKHTDVVNKICNKFDIKNDKTYNPPLTLLKHDNELLKYLIVGFIDGDGCIKKIYKRNDCNIQIKLHSSWINILREFCYIIGYNKKHAKINNHGFASLIISNSITIKMLKECSKDVPSMKRKWEIIDENFVSRYIKAKITREKVIELLNKGVRKTDIAKDLGISSPYVTKISKLCQNK